jgi:Protein of unknown function (DUF2793)
MACSRPAVDILLLRPNLILTAHLSRILPASRIFLEAQMDQSPRLSLSYLMPAQAQKHVTVNETFRRLDQLVQQTVLSRTLAAEPGAPNDGDAYILPASPTGTAWATFAQNNVAAYQDGAWIEISAEEGFSAWVADTDEFIIYDGAAWNPVSGGGETAAKFGVNTTADATNKLAVKSNAVLFDALDVAESGTGDSQIKVNKEAVGDTASHLFQTGFSGRAEFGLTGDDDFHVKVSANGSSWNDAIQIDNSNGNVGINAFPFTTSSKLSIAYIPTADFTPAINTAYAALAFKGNNNGFAGMTISSPNTGSQTCAIAFGDIASGIAGTISYTHSNDRMLFGTKGGVIRGHFDLGLVIGSPTGGDKGAGMINAVGVYDDNTLLSCYVFDQALDGAINNSKWDALVPDRDIEEQTVPDEKTGQPKIVQPARRVARTHEPLRKFATRIGGVHDPLTLDGYARHWKEKRHLTSMPNEATFNPEQGMAAGAWIQRLVETVEIQAVLIEELNQRVTTLEAAKPAQ